MGKYDVLIRLNSLESLVFTWKVGNEIDKTKLTRKVVYCMPVKSHELHKLICL